MGDTGDRFIGLILGLVDTGFGLIESQVFGLTSLLIMATFALLGVRFIMSGEEGRAVIAQFFMTVLYVGFLTWVIKAWPQLYEQVGSYFQELGGVAGGVSDAGEMMRKPSRVLATFDLAKAPIEKTIDDLSGGVKGLWNGGKVLSFATALWLLSAAFLIVYLNLFFAVVEFHLVALAAWPFLAFSAFKGSAFLAERPLGFVFAAGAKLFVMTMVLGFSLNFYDKSLPPVDPTLNQALEAAVMALVLMILAFAVPVTAAALISGGPGLSAALPMATAVGAALVVKEGVSAARSVATGPAARTVGSATATAAQRAGQSFNTSFSPGGAANVAMSAMRGGNAVRATGPASSATSKAAGAASAAASAGGSPGGKKAPPRGGAWDEAPTDKQLGAASKMKVNLDGMTRGEASVALEKAGMDPAWEGAKGKNGGSSSSGSSAIAGMRAAARRGAANSRPTDLLQRIRTAIPPGTEGQSSGSAPRLSGDV